MTDKKDEALKLALEALEHLQPTALTSFYTIGDRDKAITALREALAEQLAQQEAQAEETVKERTPQERRDAGEWHCPECFTFGHQHRQGCTAAHGIKENT